MSGMETPLRKGVRPEPELLEPINIKALNICSDVHVHWCRREAKRILHNISASFEPACVTAVMGASGAGKSTLLSVLRSGSATSGQLLLNGQPYSAQSRRFIKFVPQDDILLPGLTAREMLMYSARLSLLDCSSEECTARVNSVLSMLRLLRDADTRIGSVEARGLSGGQRKRVSIGLELLADPAVLLIDEPTSGLDSSMAFEVGSTLRQLALAGRTVVATIHQPSARLFSTFSRLLLLTSGRIAFCGPRDEAVTHFAQLGYPIPENDNPAEFFISILEEPVRRPSHERQSHIHPSTSTSIDVSSTPISSNGYFAPISFADEWDAIADPCRNSGSEPFRGQENQRWPSFMPAAVPWHRRVFSGLIPTCVLLERKLCDMTKDRRKLAKSLMLRFAVGLLIGLLFINQGRSKSFSSIFPTTSTMFIAVINSNTDTILEALLQAPLTRALLTREYLNGLYSCEAYFVATMTANILGAGVSTCFIVVPLYLLVGFAPTWLQAFRFLSSLCIVTVIGSTIGFVTGTLSKNFDSARVMLMPILAPQMIFAGYVLPLRSIPSCFKWLYYASFWQYTLGILQINEFADRVFTEDCPQQIADEVLYHELRQFIEHHHLLNITLPSHHAFHGNCSGVYGLTQAGLWPVKFGGLQGYFSILVGYMVVSMLFGYVIVKYVCARLK
mmetsp:Transcript_32842/g.54250  ORF Transcript_32842/g.54250 Transcript_32842/m.54250 type:complete len:673 (+) Transcript_32842:146-2164(+)|eukprot:CAMPEP_0119321264 /NCGR_PEP_ID=MMETSP1333-20130426/54912_1 /TAXON_ID=418940 /ORGANISM="Scyphosphaera apsteinii, Strain RCC1455" /LENGTH=672 /DNA_ID=CAMNT_0007328207 /DNA_START=136 /DNA_END=2154 /DNA_ORIENTATION=+